MAESILRETIIKVLNKGYDIEAGSQDKFNNLVKNLELAISEKFIPYKKEIDLGFCKVLIDEKVKSISISGKEKVHGEYSVPGFRVTMVDGKIIISNHPEVLVVDSNGSFHSCVAKVTGCVLEVFKDNRIIPVVDKEQVVGDSIADDTDKMPKLFQELELRISGKYNSNFRINTLNTCTKAVIKELCEIIDETFNNIKQNQFDVDNKYTGEVQNGIKIQNGKVYKVKFGSNITIVEASKLPETIAHYLIQKKDITITQVGRVANYDSETITEY